MLPPGLFLAWLLARGRFHGRLILDTAISLPLVMPPVATGLVLLAMVGAARAGRQPACACGHRGRVYLESGGVGDGGDGPAAVRADGARRYRAGRSTLRGGGRDARRGAVACVLHGDPSACASSRAGGRRPGVRAGVRRIRRDDHDRRKHSGRRRERWRLPSIPLRKPAGRRCGAFVAVSAAIAFVALAAANWISSRQGIQA